MMKKPMWCLRNSFHGFAEIWERFCVAAAAFWRPARKQLHDTSPHVRTSVETLAAIPLILAMALSLSAAPQVKATRWSINDTIKIQMATGRQFFLKGQFTIRAQAGNLEGEAIPVVIAGKMNGQELKPVRVKIRRTEKGVRHLRNGESLKCTSILMKGHDILRFR